MTPYITMADLSGLIPDAFLTEALDDDQDGQADPAALNKVLEGASNGVDAILGLRFTVPLANPLPTVVIEAAKVFAAELCHTRRGKTPDQNPFAKQADGMRARLEKIAKGELPLAPTLERARPSGVVITSPSKSSRVGATAV